MGRLIDADELFVKWQTTMMKIGEPVSVLYILAAMSDLQQAPTVDAVPVTRCVDCKWCRKFYHGHGMQFSYECAMLYLTRIEANDFCSKAKRKEE